MRTRAYAAPWSNTWQSQRPCALLTVLWASRKAVRWESAKSKPLAPVPVAPSEPDAVRNSWRTLARLFSEIVTNSWPRSARKFTRRSNGGSSRRHAAYAATLVKRQPQRVTFDAVFDIWFPRLIGSGVAGDGLEPVAGPTDTGPQLERFRALGRDYAKMCSDLVAEREAGAWAAGADLRRRRQPRHRGARMGGES